MQGTNFLWKDVSKDSFIKKNIEWEIVGIGKDEESVVLVVLLVVV